MNSKLLALSLISVIFLGCTENEKWISLFNGKDLTNWTVKIKGHPVGNNYNNTFIVENGVLKVDYTKYNNKFNNTFGHIYYNTPFSNYRFKMDYRFVGEQLSDGADWATRNSGVMIHCEDPNFIGLDQNFPVSIEVQLLGGNGMDDRTTANLCTPGTHVTIGESLIEEHCTTSTSETYHGDQWVHLEIEVRGDSIIKHFINGKEVMRYHKPQYGGKVDHNNEYWKTLEGKPLKKGYISLQSESHPIEFKNIALLNLEN